MYTLILAAVIGKSFPDTFSYLLPDINIDIRVLLFGKRDGIK